MPPETLNVKSYARSSAVRVALRRRIEEITPLANSQYLSEGSRRIFSDEIVVLKEMIAELEAW